VGSEDARGEDGYRRKLKGRENWKLGERSGVQIQPEVSVVDGVGGLFIDMTGSELSARVPITN